MSNISSEKDAYYAALHSHLLNCSFCTLNMLKEVFYGKSHCIFYSSPGADGPIKIGITNDLDKRIITLQTGNPLKLNALYSLEVEEDKANDIERQLHEKFGYQQMQGEWFRPNEYIIESINILKGKGIVGLVEHEEKQIFDCWAKISGPIHEITEVAKGYRTSGNVWALKYITAELNELIDDLKTGRY